MSKNSQNNPDFNRVKFDTVKKQSDSKGDKAIVSFCAKRSGVAESILVGE